MTDRSSLPFDPVHKPSHYNSHASGVETVQLTEHLSAMLGSAVKYVWRRGLKGPIVQDLEKAAWCFRREAERLRAFKDASPWDIEAWKPLAEKVAIQDETVLGDVLRELLQAAMFDNHLANSCDKMAALCDSEAKRLRRDGL